MPLRATANPRANPLANPRPVLWPCFPPLRLHCCATDNITSSSRPDRWIDSTNARLVPRAKLLAFRRVRRGSAIVRVFPGGCSDPPVRPTFPGRSCVARDILENPHLPVPFPARPYHPGYRYPLAAHRAAASRCAGFSVVVRKGGSRGCLGASCAGRGLAFSRRIFRECSFILSNETLGSRASGDPSRRNRRRIALKVADRDPSARVGQNPAHAETRRVAERAVYK